MKRQKNIVWGETVKPKAKKIILYLLLFLPVALLFAYVAGGHKDFLAEAVFIGIFWLINSALAIMAVELKHSLEKTLYDYKNIMLVGGILFLFTMAVALFLWIFFDYYKNPISVQTVYDVVLAFPEKFSYYAVFILSAICVLLGVSNIELLRKEGFHLHNALSVLLAALYLGGTAAVYILSDLLEEHTGTETPLTAFLNIAFPLFCLLMLCYFECILAGTAVMGYRAAKQVPAYDKDYIIILGCSIDKKGGLLPLLKGRVDRAVRYAWEQERTSGKSLRYIPSGGKGSNEVISEASAMELYLLSHGAEREEVIPENRSTNTYENMKFSKAILDKLDPDAKVAFATTNYHMLRSGILAQKVGLDAEGIAAATKWYFWPNGFLREFFAIIVMHLKSHIAVGAALLILSVLVGFAGSMGFMG